MPEATNQLPIEALALLDYAERNGLLIGPGDNNDEHALNPDFLYTAHQIKVGMVEGRYCPFIDLTRYDLWRLVDPKDVLIKLEKDYKIAQSYLDAFRVRMAELSNRDN